MGRLTQLLNTARSAPSKAVDVANETLIQLRARLAAPKRRTVVLAKALPADQAKKPLPKDMAELRRELDAAVAAGKVSAVDARDICHQFAAGQKLPDDLAIKLAAILQLKPKAHSYDNPKRTAQMKSELRADLAQAVKEKKISATDAAKAEHLLNVGKELPDDLKIQIGKHTA